MGDIAGAVIRLRNADCGLRIDEALRPRPAGSLWLSDSLRSAAECGFWNADLGSSCLTGVGGWG